MFECCVPHPSSRRSSRGFTLLELVITMAVAAILLGIAVPAFRSYVQNSRLSTQAQSLVYSLNLARSEAVKLDTQVEVCASTDGATCSGMNWSTGWIVCYPVGTCPTVLQVSPGLSGGNAVVEVLSGASSVTYSSAGQTPAAYEFVFCDNRGASYGRDVEVNLIGRIEPAQNPGQTVAGVALGSCI